MKQDLLASLRAAVVALLAFTVLTGVIYPAVVHAIAQTVFPHQANGSMIDDGGELRGSELVGQAFTHPAYFWSRPSAIGPFPYDATSSVGTNQGMGGKSSREPINPALRAAVRDRVEALRAADPENTSKVPVDLVTASASGLDPHISPAAASYQAGRIARARTLSVEDVRAMIEAHTEGRTLGFLGEPRVNVLAINRALDVRSGPPR